MPVARGISEAMRAGSWIRRMFERGRELKARLGPDAVFDLSLGNPLLEPPAAFRKALADIAAEPPAGWHRYMTHAGFPEVREAIAEHLGRKGLLRTTGDHIVMCCGAGGGLNVALKTLLDPGDEVIILAPFFPEYHPYVANHGGRGVVAQTDASFLPDLAEVERHLTSRTKAILLNSPNNPTGRVYPKALLQSLADLLERHGRAAGRPVTILSDEPYREIVYGGDGIAPSMASIYPHTIQVYSWSKSLSVPGERIGYIAVNPETPEARSLVDGLIFSTRVLGFINAPATLQRAVARLLDVDADVATYRAKRDRVVAALQAAGYDLVAPEAAFYVFPKSPIPDDVAFCEKAIEEMVLVVPGCGFGRAGHFRLAYCTDDRTIDEGMKRLARVTEKLRGIQGGA